MRNKNIAVLGAGSWGTALAVHLGKRGYSVNLWETVQKIADELKEKRQNPHFLPGIMIPEEVKITCDIKEAVLEVNVVVIAVPSHAVREVVKRLPVLSEDTILLSAAKGIENKTLLRMSQIITEVVQSRSVAVISGPSHAEEVSRDIPTTVVVSSQNAEVGRFIQRLFMSERFRVYTNHDLIGVELGGALKNIVAIAAGISDGLGFGSNTKAALLTRGLAEISRLGVAMGANPHTFAGLSGMGDLATTCISKYSRNRALGEAIAKGKTLSEAMNEIGQVAEGIKTTESAYELAKLHRVEMPITEQVNAVLFKGKTPRQAVDNLMMRGAKAELEKDFLG